MALEAAYHSEVFEIAFVGNERDLIHAFRALLRYHLIQTKESRAYKVFLFGKFPGEILQGKDFHHQWIDDNRDAVDCYQQQYHIILDAERDYSSDTGLSLSQWYEYKLGLQPERKQVPFYVSRSVPNSFQGEHRMRRAGQGFGNTIFFMPASTQDAEWSSINMHGEFWRDCISTLINKQYTIVYPQVRLANMLEQDSYNHSFFFAGYEDSIFSLCHTPVCEKIDDIVFYLLHCRLFVGWNNWIADLAAAHYIPTISFGLKSVEEDRHCQSGEFLFAHHCVAEPERWHCDYFKQKLHYVETRLRSLP